MSLVAPKIIVLKNKKEINLRSPEPEDAGVLLTHLKNIFQQSYRNMNHPQNHWDNFLVEDEAKILTEFKNSNQQFMISAFDGERIVGNLGLFGMSATFLKHNARLGMGIETEYHHIGLGTALITYALENAKALGFKRIELTVRAFNQPGILLYEKVGFKRVGTLKKAAFIDGEYHDEYMYEILMPN